GDVAHLISRGAPTSGGVAWVDQLCGPLPYAYSWIQGTYNGFPTYSWTVEVVAHEMGHNLGAPHTHACYWTVNNVPNQKIDQCGDFAGATECNANSPGLPVEGTVMSYCHLIGGVGISFLEGFHPIVATVLQGEIMGAQCLTVCGAEGDCEVDFDPPYFTTFPLPADVTVECFEVPPPATLEADDECAGAVYAFINEIHYDNTGGDVNEMVEIAGVAGLDLTGWELVLYNGSNGTVYTTTPLSGVIPNESNNMGAIAFTYPANGLQNGSPDGIALVDNGALVQFLSYEGTFVGVGGPANGIMSTDIGVSENGGEPIGLSLQLIGIGNSYGDFMWSGPSAESPGSLNASQEINPAPGSVTVDFQEERIDGNCPNEYILIRTWTATDPAGNDTTHTQIVTVVDNTGPMFCTQIDRVITVECDEVAGLPVVTAHDNCGNDPMMNVEPWINEFHYDNVGTDEGEFVEVAGPGGLDLANYILYLYNGSDGTVYNQVSLSGVLPFSNCGVGFSVMEFPVNGIQNGSPDGFALVFDDGNTVSVVEFISYEGSFLATNGPANGMLSTDVGVEEGTSTPVGFSLQRSGIGTTGNDFTWIGPVAETRGF